MDYYARRDMLTLVRNLEGHVVAVAETLHDVNHFRHTFVTLVPDGNKRCVPMRTLPQSRRVAKYYECQSGTSECHIQHVWI